MANKPTPEQVNTSFLNAWNEFGDDKSTEFLVQITAERLSIKPEDVYAGLAAFPMLLHIPPTSALTPTATGVRPMAKKRTFEQEYDELVDIFANTFHSFRDLHNVSPIQFVTKLEKRGVTFARKVKRRRVPVAGSKQPGKP